MGYVLFIALSHHLKILDSDYIKTTPHPSFAGFLQLCGIAVLMRGKNLSIRCYNVVILHP